MNKKSSKIKVVFISGASSGIGRACALHLAKKSYKVYGTSRDIETVEEFRKNAASQNGYFEMLQMDVNNETLVKRGINYIFEKEGQLDVVVNNAGFGIAGSVEDTSIEEAKAQFETIFFGVLRVCQATLPIMREQHFGYIINIGSIEGLIGIPFQGIYSAGKFALEGMSEALRIEVRSFGIQVVLIDPGNFQTQFAARREKTFQSQEENSAYKEKFNNAWKRLEIDGKKGSSPEKIAYLLEKIINNPSPKARYVIGSLTEKMGVSLKRIIPRWLFDWGLMKHYDIN